MLVAASLLNSADVINEEIGRKDENPERKLKLISYKNDKNESRHRVLLEFADLYFQLVDSNAHEEAKQLFLLSSTVIPCFWSPKVASHLPTILSTKVLTKLVELMMEHGDTWSVAHMCVCLPLPEDTMMILLASDALKEHFTSTHHPKMYRLLHLAIEQKSVDACRAIMRCSEFWLQEDPGLSAKDLDQKLPIQKALDIGAQECVKYLLEVQSFHDMFSKRTGGIFGFFTTDVPQSFQTALETKNCSKVKELLQSHPALVRADFTDGNTGLHKAKDAKVCSQCVCLSWSYVMTVVGMCGAYVHICGYYVSCKLHLDNFHNHVLVLMKNIIIIIDIMTVNALMIFVKCTNLL